MCHIRTYRSWLTLNSEINAVLDAFIKEKERCKSKLGYLEHILKKGVRKLLSESSNKWPRKQKN